jgi:hypothetical protein
LLGQGRRLIVARQSGLQDGKFIAAHARYEAVAPRERFQLLSQRDQIFVADRMPSCVIDGLKSIDVDQMQCETPVAASRPRDFESDPFAQEAAIWHVSE